MAGVTWHIRLRELGRSLLSGSRIDDGRLNASSNNLNVTRLILASAVIFSHCKKAIVGTDDDLLSTLIGYPVSSVAVDGFFFLSGFLVYRSLDRKNDVIAFTKARLVRMWPAIAVMVMATVIVGLGFGSTLGPKTNAFIVANLLLQAKHYEMDGIGVVNGSLWSITWEVRCYVVLALLGVAGLTRRNVMIGIVVASYGLAVAYHYTALEYSTGTTAYYLILIDRLWTQFALGIAAYLFHRRIVLSWAVAAALVGAAILAFQFQVPLHLGAIAIGYLVLCMGFKTGNRSAGWHDYSFGMYLYAYPVMLLTLRIWPIRDYGVLTVVNAVLTVPIAALSWHLVERPALALRTRFDRSRKTQAVANNRVAGMTAEQR